MYGSFGQAQPIDLKALGEQNPSVKAAVAMFALARMFGTTPPFEYEDVIMTLAGIDPAQPRDYKYQILESRLQMWSWFDSPEQIAQYMKSAVTTDPEPDPNQQFLSKTIKGMLWNAIFVGGRVGFIPVIFRGINEQGLLTETVPIYGQAGEGENIIGYQEFVKTMEGERIFTGEGTRISSVEFPLHGDKQAIAVRHAIHAGQDMPDWCYKIDPEYYLWKLLNYFFYSERGADMSRISSIQGYVVGKRGWFLQLAWDAVTEAVLYPAAASVPMTSQGEVIQPVNQPYGSGESYGTSTGEEYAYTPEYISVTGSQLPAGQTASAETVGTIPEGFIEVPSENISDLISSGVLPADTQSAYINPDTGETIYTTADVGVKSAGLAATLGLVALIFYVMTRKNK